MTPTEIEITIGNLIFDVGLQLEKIEQALTLEKQLDGSSVLQLCADYRQIGIAMLLDEMDVDALYENLYQSARAYAFFLATVRNDPEADVYYARRSQADPFWDALAGDDRASAREICTLVTQELQRGMEDEEAFHYYDFVMTLVEGTQEQGVLEEKLMRFEQILGETESHSFNLCAALLQREAGLFVEALSDRIRAREIYFEQAREQAWLEPGPAQTEAFVFVEGIALVKLALSLQMAVEEQYKFIPNLVFTPPSPDLERIDPWTR